MSNIEHVLSELIKYNADGLPLEDMKNYYLNRCKHEVREDTYNYYNKYLTKIVDFLKKNKIKSTHQINNPILYKFIDNRRSHGNKNNTINKYIGTLKQALSYCEEQELIQRNPMSKFKKLRSDDVETIIIDENIIKSIIMYLKTTEQTHEVIRAKVMIYILLDTGIRKNELRNIKLTNLDLNNNKINLTFTKTHKNRTVYLSEPTIAALQIYIEQVEPNNYLIVSLHNGVQLSAKAMEDVIAKIKRKLNIPSEVSISFHKFRHTFATMFLIENGNVDTVRKLLGHSSIKTTQLYLHQVSNKLQSEHSKYTPINKFL